MVVRVLIALAFVSLFGSQTQSPSPALTATPFHANGIYSQDEEAGWVVTPGIAALGQKVPFTLKENNHKLLQQGELDLSSGKAVVQTKLSEPAMIMLELKPEGHPPMLFGAAINPTQLKPVQTKPADFDAFWKAKIAAMEQTAPNPKYMAVSRPQTDIDYGLLTLDIGGGQHAFGQIATPKKPGKHPAMLILQWASPPYPLDPWWVIGPAEQGWIALNVEPHEVLPTEPRSYYDALPKELRNYQMIGQDDRDKSYFVTMYLRGVRATDYLASRPDWNGKVLLVTGGSMGGQQSLAVAGLDPKITDVIVDEPAGCDLAAGNFGRQEGYPFFPVNDLKVMAAARYVDVVNFTSNIRAKCLVSMGFVDTVAPATGIWTAFNEIRGQKEAAPMVNAPHNNLVTPEQHLPYTSRAAAWMEELVKQ